MTFEADLALGLHLSDTARSISLARFRGKYETRTKKDGTLVTEVDEAVEDELRRILQAERKEDAILGEERGQTGQGRRRWIIDAIDGTVSFAEGTTLWCTLIALEVDNQIVVGVCDMAPLDRRYWALRGGGAFVSSDGSDGLQIHVSKIRDLHKARSYVTSPQRLRDESLRAKAEKLLSATTPRPYTSHPVLDVAAGSREVSVFFSAGPWDIAAPAIIVEEAGGRFTNLAGEVDIMQGGAVFSNSYLHDDILRITKKG